MAKKIWLRALVNSLHLGLLLILSYKKFHPILGHSLLYNHLFTWLPGEWWPKFVNESKWYFAPEIKDDALPEVEQTQTIEFNSNLVPTWQQSRLKCAIGIDQLELMIPSSARVSSLYNTRDSLTWLTSGHKDWTFNIKFTFYLSQTISQTDKQLGECWASLLMLETFSSLFNVEFAERL